MSPTGLGATQGGGLNGVLAESPAGARGVGEGLDWTPTAAAAALIAAFALAAAARLDVGCLFDPDSTEYVFLARSLATGRGYRILYHPSQPVMTWRPPGLPLLLLPAAWLAPCNVAAAKVCVLAHMLAVLALFYIYSRPQSGRWLPVCTLAALATSPFTLLLGTEVLSEAAYTAGSLAVLWIVARRPERPSAGQVAALTALLAAVPLIRSVGLALLLAVALWAVVRRSRWPWLVPVSVSVAVYGLWTWRNLAAGGPTYAATTLESMGQMGVGPAARVALLSLLFYVGQFCRLLIPGSGVDEPLYAAVTVNPPPDLPVPDGLVLMAGLAAVLVVCLGMYARRGAASRLAGLYVLVYLAALALYPMRHERLLWPLLPVLLAYVPAGLAMAGTAVLNLAPVAVSRLGRAGLVVGVGLLAALVGWQGWACAAMVAGSVQVRFADARFYADAQPPFHLCDWAAAGRWLRHHTGAYERVLTQHAVLACSSGRFQQVVDFEDMTASGLRTAIADFGARYLVLYAPTFHIGFSGRMADSDLVYRFRPVYEAGGVVVLAVLPNRSGTVSCRPDDWGWQIAACRRVLRRYPRRRKLRVRLAYLLWQAGELEPAIRELREEIEQGCRNIRAYRLLGFLYLEAGRNRAALQCFRAASFLPEAERFRAGLEQGMELARRRLRASGVGGDSGSGRATTAADGHRSEPGGGGGSVPGPLGGSASPSTGPARLVAAAVRLAGEMRFARAWELADRAAEQYPHDPTALFLRAELLQRFGQLERAEAEFEKALRAGYSQAADKLVLLGWAKALLADGPGQFVVAGRRYRVDRSDPASYVELAELCRRDRTPGLALSVLEAAASRFGNNRQVLSRLAELYRYYAMLPEAAAAYEKLLRQAVPEVHQAVASLRAAMQPPQF